MPSKISSPPQPSTKRRDPGDRLGKHYTESEVNEVLHGFHTDVATLRRCLIDEGHLDREGGQYWRSGGRTDAH